MTHLAKQEIPGIGKKQAVYMPGAPNLIRIGESVEGDGGAFVWQRGQCQLIPKEQAHLVQTPDEAVPPTDFHM